MYYKELEQGIEGCKSCNIRDSVEANLTYGPMYGYGGNVVMICGLAPSYIRGSLSKYTLSRDHSNYTAGTLFKVLDDTKWPTEKTYFTNLMKCSLPENRKPLPEEIDACYEKWFSQELFLVNPIAIVSLGKYVRDYLKEKNLNILVFEVDHFSFIHRNPTKYDSWKNQWMMVGKRIKEVINIEKRKYELND